MPELNFKGKEFVYNHHLSVPFRPLVSKPDQSVGEPRLDGNLIIHGDNLHALKALLPMYAGKVDCVFIDPPYNTGNEGWCYNDNVNSPLMREWLSNNPVSIDDGLRHDKWCAMMWPRLRLLWELMSEDGFIFVCVDQNETHHLRMLLNEIFGEANFRNEIIMRRGVKNVQSQFEDIDRLAVGHDTLYLYSKNVNSRLPKLMKTSETDQPGKWDTFWRGTDRPTMRYTLFGVTPEAGQWRWKEARALEAKANYEDYLSNFADTLSLDEFYYLRTQELGAACDFVRFSEDQVVQYYVPPRDFKLFSDVWMRVPTAGRVTDFPHEKHVELVQTAVEWVTNSNSIVLDSFAGSGTTAHAVINANKVDGGVRRFLMVECEDYAEAITAQRVRKALINAGPGSPSSLVPGSDNGFSFCELGEPLQLDSLLSGEQLPSAGALGSILFHMATAASYDQKLANSIEPPFDGIKYLGSANGAAIWLIYKPDIDFLKSSDAALTLSKAREVARLLPDTQHVVFAPARFVSRKVLADHQLPVEFAPLPFALYRIELS